MTGTILISSILILAAIDAAVVFKGNAKEQKFQQLLQDKSFKWKVCNDVAIQYQNTDSTTIDGYIYSIGRIDSHGDQQITIKLDDYNCEMNMLNEYVVILYNFDTGVYYDGYNKQEVKLFELIKE